MNTSQATITSCWICCSEPTVWWRAC